MAHDVSKLKVQFPLWRIEGDAIHAAMNNLMAELETLPTGLTGQDADAYRADIRTRYAQRLTERRTTQHELDTLTTPAQPAHDPALLDQIPQLGDWLTTAPETTQHAIYDAFQLTITYHRPTHQATLRATLTNTTPHALETALHTSRDTTPPTTPPTPTTRNCHLPPPPMVVHATMKPCRTKARSSRANSPF